jgi:hypothetical protein
MAQIQAVAGGGTAPSLVINITSSGARPLVCVGWTGAGVNGVTSITDNLTQTWTKRNNTNAIFIYDCLTSAAGVTQVTINVASANVMAIVMERDDLASYDQSTQTEVGTGTTWDSGNVTTTQATELAIGIVGTFSGGQATSLYVGAGGSWSDLTGTNVTSGRIDSGLGDSSYVELSDLSATGTYSASGTCASVYNYAGIATYKKILAGINLAWVTA